MLWRATTVVIAGTFWTLFGDIAKVGVVSMQAAFAGSAVIGGRRLSCRAAKVVKSRRVPTVGYARKGVIVLNPKLLRKYPSVTRRMIFMHECAHQYVGFDETAADCWAVKIGKRQGWLSEKGVRQVCRSFSNSPGTAYHLPGPARCKAMLQCYRNAKGRRVRKRNAARRKKR